MPRNKKTVLLRFSGKEQLKVLAETEKAAKELGISRTAFINIALLEHVAEIESAKYNEPQAFMGGVKFAIEMLYGVKS